MACGTPSIIMLPGSFVPASVLYPVRDAVSGQGFEFLALDLATVRLPNDTRTPPSMYDDAALIIREVEKLADQGKDVIVISHSYSGIPMSQAAAGLGKKSRMSQGKRGGIVKLGYVTSFVPALGQTSNDMLGDVPDDQRVDIRIDEQGWMWQTNLTRTAELVFNDLPLEDGLAWANRFSQHSAQSFMDPATQIGYTDEDIELAYLFCEHDRTIPPQNQAVAIDNLRSTGKTVDVTSIAADHGPMISHENLVVDWILDIASSL
ncbi:hypothetical protein S7711_01864 [Stachybotrys chartarum IBT 7711]|uniref:AB hydrolase-1 domain-containing protein n=1 Tax=Stachybotrys chartarum (strain CBS 109288 / IBT 7711) TaxID=1280523 RepID=A0A084AJ75_STACB|nr:hypothetical protein S7711_01864 [Stachybotrys chartarum IBT 7711]KFA47556.1 hypothetical protein S40293_02183 [Stachybotrys chartarum IBT 40293]